MKTYLLPGPNKQSQQQCLGSAQRIPEKDVGLTLSGESRGSRLVKKAASCENERELQDSLVLDASNALVALGV